MTTITPALSRAGRALLDWPRKRLAQEAGITERALTAFEGGNSSPYERTLVALQSSMEKAGVTFFTFNGTIGVGIKRQAP